MDAKKRVAKNLRRLRTERERTQEELAAKAGIERAYISRIERGLENPTVGLLARLAKALKADVSEFLLRPPIARSLRPTGRPSRKKAS